MNSRATAATPIDAAIEQAFASKKTLASNEVASLLGVGLTMAEEWARSRDVVRWSISDVDDFQSALESE